MRTSGEETEVTRLREENHHLQRLLAEYEKRQKALSASEQQIVAQSHELSHTREHLKQQVRLFDTILSSIVDFAYTFDPDGRFYANQALLDLWQIKLEDAVGKNFFELNYPSEPAARLQRQIQSVFENGTLLKDETPYTGAAGMTGYYEYIFTVINDGVGFSQGFDPMTRVNIGLELVESLVRTDLQGRNEYGNRPQGGPVMVTFPLPANED